MPSNNTTPGSLFSLRNASSGRLPLFGRTTTREEKVRPRKVSAEASTSTSTSRLLEFLSGASRTKEPPSAAPPSLDIRRTESQPARSRLHVMTKKGAASHGPTAREAVAPVSKMEVPTGKGSALEGLPPPSLSEDVSARQSALHRAPAMEDIRAVPTISARHEAASIATQELAQTSPNLLLEHPERRAEERTAAKPQTLASLPPLRLDDLATSDVGELWHTPPSVFEVPTPQALEAGSITSRATPKPIASVADRPGIERARDTDDDVPLGILVQERKEAEAPAAISNSTAARDSSITLTGPPSSFPRRGAPRRLGSFSLDGGDVTVRLSPSVISRAPLPIDLPTRWRPPQSPLVPGMSTPPVASTPGAGGIQGQSPSMVQVQTNGQSQGSSTRQNSSLPAVQSPGGNVLSEGGLQASLSRRRDRTQSVSREERVMRRMPTLTAYPAPGEEDGEGSGSGSDDDNSGSDDDDDEEASGSGEQAEDEQAARDRQVEIPQAMPQDYFSPRPRTATLKTPQSPPPPYLGKRQAGMPSPGLALGIEEVPRVVHLHPDARPLLSPSAEEEEDYIGELDYRLPSDSTGLPVYSNAIYLRAEMARKVEFTKPGVQAKDRKWRRVFVELEGTVLRIWEQREGKGVGGWWEGVVGAGDVTEGVLPNGPPGSVGAAASTSDASNSRQRRGNASEQPVAEDPKSGEREATAVRLQPPSPPRPQHVQFPLDFFSLVLWVAVQAGRRQHLPWTLGFGLMGICLSLIRQRSCVWWRGWTFRTDHGVVRAV
ncbi:hypothetical protein CYLTODRAFT_40209 [Cylindrobasidium torrendii FP15055 ss-10]|uniref:PH domain-containing protein n=1 Tax=Cylindrobasidium torrendii FP15055 ss-10 TaxID=1314674 RepID=A0A0D7B7N7_9AGAR|nr:hypothetical protein CYLTODRAFT_40209 [Cylindrobasidium torrendii FP15055 ss-10]